MRPAQLMRRGERGLRGRAGDPRRARTVLVDAIGRPPAGRVQRAEQCLLRLEGGIVVGVGGGVEVEVVHGSFACAMRCAVNEAAGPDVGGRDVERLAQWIEAPIPRAYVDARR